MAKMKMTPETEFKLFELENKMHKTGLTARVLATGLQGELERLVHDDEPHMPQAARWQGIKDVFKSLDQVITDGIATEAQFYKLRDESLWKSPRRIAAPRKPRVPSKKD